MCVSAGVFILGMVSIIHTDFIGKHSGVEIRETVDEIHRTSTLFDMMRSRHTAQSQERELVNTLVLDARRLAGEIDSICQLRQLTRKDTILLADKKQKLDIIINTLRRNEKD